MNKKIILHLLGMPAAGKYTIAKEFCEKYPNTTLIDNHKINNALFQIVDTSKDLPPQIFGYLDDIYDVLFEAMKTIAPRDKHFVFTNVFFEGDKNAEKFIEKKKEMAKEMGYVYCPIVLDCEHDELVNRVVTPERAEKMKLTDPNMLKKFIVDKKVFKTYDENELVLKTTTMTTTEVVEKIEEHINGISKDV